MIKTFFNKLKIREKIFVIICLIMFGVCLISMAAVQVAADIYEHRIYTEAAEVLNLTSSTVDSELREIEDLTQQIATDSRMQEYLARLNSDTPNYENYRVQRDMYDLMLYYMQKEKYFSSLQIIDSNGNKHVTVLYNIGNNSRDLYQVAVQAEGRNVWLPGEDDSQTLLAVRQIRGMKNLNLSHYGVLTIWIDMKKMVSQFLDFSEDKSFVIVQDGEIIFSNKDDFIGESAFFSLSRKGFAIREINGEKYMIAHWTSHYNNTMVYYNILPYDTIASQMKHLRMMMVTVLAVLFLLALLVGRVASHSMTKPLVSLTEKMKQVQMGNFSIIDSLDGIPNMDETGHLHRNFRIMLEKINELFKENYHKQLLIQETEYRALQAQINPHFLYNTLDTVNWLAKMNKQNQISEMVEALGNMLRNIIGRKHPLIPIADEMEIIRDYIVIQKNRFDDRLDFHMSVDREAGNCLIPKLTIQPLVENAIQHGLEVITGVCRICVEVKTGTHLEISVSDNGPGMDRELFDALKQGRVQSKGSGIGLKNIEERIKLLFGEPYGLDFEGGPGRGTTVRILLPIQAGGSVKDV